MKLQYKTIIHEIKQGFEWHRIVLNLGSRLNYINIKDFYSDNIHNVHKDIFRNSLQSISEEAKVRPAKDFLWPFRKLYYGTLRT